MCPDGLVYNLEVEGTHNYYANDILVHNCHHTPAASFKSILDCYPDAHIIGLTATPVHGMRGLRGYFDDIVIGAKPSELVEKGWIVSPDVFTVPEEMMPDVSKVKTTKDGEFDQRQLAEACERWDIVGPIVEHWKQHGRGAQTIAFAASVKESRMIEESFKSAFVPVAHLDGTMHEADRDRIFTQLRNGEIKVVTNVDICTEGFDAPIVKTIIMARPTQSIVVYIQEAGRGMRKYGSERATLLDHVGNVQRFGFPDEDIEWGLGDPPRKRVSIKRCPQCWAANASNARVCVNPSGECGPPPYEWTREENEKIERELIAAEGRLARAVRDRATEDPKMDHWVGYTREALVKEYSETWARNQFKQRFGEWPHEAKYRFPPRPQASWPDARRRKKLDELVNAARAGAAAKFGKDPSAWYEEKYEMLFGEPTAALLARENGKLAAHPRSLGGKQLTLPAPTGALGPDGETDF